MNIEYLRELTRGECPEWVLECIVDQHEREVKESRNIFEINHVHGYPEDYVCPYKTQQEIKDRLNHFYRQTDGSFSFPNSAEGDLLKLVSKYFF